MENEKKTWLDDHRNVEKIYWGLCGVCALILIPDFFFHKHGHFSWEGWIGFYGAYGFVSCVGLVLAAKQLRKVLQRREDYYDA